MVFNDNDFVFQSTGITPTTSASSQRDEIYIDDQGIEGSGGRGEVITEF